MNQTLLVLCLTLLAAAEGRAQILVYNVTQTGVRTQLKYDASSSAARQFPLSSVVVKRYFLAIDWREKNGTELNQGLAFVDYSSELDRNGTVRKSYTTTLGWRYRYAPVNVNPRVNPLTASLTGEPNTYNTLNNGPYTSLLDPSDPEAEYFVLQNHMQGAVLTDGAGNITTEDPDDPDDPNDTVSYEASYVASRNVFPFVPAPIFGMGLGRQYANESLPGENPFIHESEVSSLLGTGVVLSNNPFLLAPRRMVGHWQDSYSFLEGLPASGLPRPTKSWFDRSAGSQVAVLVGSLSLLDGTLAEAVTLITERLQGLGYNLTSTSPE
jgi:hypothetical protein